MLLIIMIFKILLITSIYLINNVNSYNLIPNVRTRRLNTRKEVTVYEPNWTDKTTPSVMLFTGADGIIPPEIYNEFLSQLSSERISVHVGVNDEDSIRLFVSLQDWSWGQYLLMGNYHWTQWSAGDVMWFRWQDLPHGSANCGHKPRYFLKITGKKTKAWETNLAENNKIIQI